MLVILTRPEGITTRKSKIQTVTAMKASNLTNSLRILNCPLQSTIISLTPQAGMPSMSLQGCEVHCHINTTAVYSYWGFKYRLEGIINRYERRKSRFIKTTNHKPETIPHPTTPVQPKSGSIIQFPVK
jgi:hypothetical protein